MISKDYYARLGLAGVYEKVTARERLSVEDGQKLFACNDLHGLGALAQHVRTGLHGDRVFYVTNRHVNYTNICVNGCLFCAFQRELGEQGGFSLDQDVILEKFATARAQGADEAHIVGGCHPKLDFSFYLELIAKVRDSFPGMGIKAFTAVEIAHFAQIAGITTREVLTQLKAAGLDMLPGGGAEIFAPEVRNQICPKKISGAEWLRIQGEAHEVGIATNSTMLYGHLESHKDRLDHLVALRELQDRSLVRGKDGASMLCFIPLPFLTENSKLKLPESVAPRTGVEDMKNMAVCRLMLDNVPHIKSYWVMLGVKTAQVALHYGADDFDGTVVEEKIGHMAGADSSQSLTRDEIESMIRGCGFTPVRRDCCFRPVADASGASA